MTTDYKKTVFLPQTGFPMKGKLPEREPAMLERWEAMNLYERQREQSKGKEKFILHDGPPYANGHLHIGHALNKILKDVVTRSQQMLGKDSNYVPGWDCHGLPIEWQIEQKYRKAGKDKDAVPLAQFRTECREFAQHWIEVQAEEFKRLGVIGDWKHPYTTMSYPAEAQIVRELGKFLLDGSLYRGAKPVMWSPVEKTALAEAEVEYHDHTSVTIYAAFPVKETDVAALEGAAVLIWTTTPWTIPGNRAIAYGIKIKYCVIEIEAVGEGALVAPGYRVAVAEELLDTLLKDAKVTTHRVLAGGLPGTVFENTLCAHPLADGGYDFSVPLLPADHVTTEQGTGFVHTAPGHGAEDFVAVQQYNARRADARHADDGRAPIEVPDTVADDGSFYDHVPLFAGKHVYKVNDEIADALQAAGGLLARGKLVHSYPHSWRSKAPLIFRNTPQWFISMTATGLRDTALRAIDETRWVPPSGQNRIRAMIEQRPDWVLSRQRVWGVPITVFVDKKSGQPLRDAAVMQRITDAIEAEGADAWFVSDAARFLGPDYNADDYEKIDDILDVWFDSGSSHSYVLEVRDDLAWPASLYLEGSDQHRGWFHSSLLESCGTRGRAPYDAVLTHGFVLDGNGRKMSKSLGNVVAPQKILKTYGADILRLWVVSADYSEDLRISDDILRYQADAYRRLRNTLRYVLGNLDGFTEEERVERADMPDLERWVLHRLHALGNDIRRWTEEFDFHSYFIALHNFCAVELSAFYFDVRKDVLYCDRRDSAKRRAARTVLDTLFNCLTAWLAPLACFTAEEAWLERHGEEDASIHLEVFPDLPAAWEDDPLAARMDRLRAVRRVTTKALEAARAERVIGSSLEANPEVFVDSQYDDALRFEGDTLAELFITSGVTVLPWDERGDEVVTLDEVPGVAARFAPAAHAKCARCWQLLPSVGADPAHADICTRCADAVEAFQAAAE